jgi:type IV secretory pathway VirB2 component (pilin)
MRESLRRRRGPGSSDDSICQRSTDRHEKEHWQGRCGPTAQTVCRLLLFTSLTVLLMTPHASAQQSPWERAASNLEQAFTGPLARSLALVAIVIGGLMFMFGEGGAKRQISGIVFGGGLALFSAQFLTWLF